MVFNEKILKDIVKNLNRDRRSVIMPLEKELENRKNGVFRLYEDGMIDKQTLAQRMESIAVEIYAQSRRRIQIKKNWKAMIQ